jgi:hypothetical protein
MAMVTSRNLYSLAMPESVGPGHRFEEASRSSWTRRCGTNQIDSAVAQGVSGRWHAELGQVSIDPLTDHVGRHTAAVAHGEDRPGRGQPERLEGTADVWVQRNRPLLAPFASTHRQTAELGAYVIDVETADLLAPETGISAQEEPAAHLRARCPLDGQAQVLVSNGTGHRGGRFRTWKRGGEEGGRGPRALPSQIRNALYEARQRELLTSPPTKGRPGGQLTLKARQLLAAAKKG